MHLRLANKNQRMDQQTTACHRLDLETPRGCMLTASLTQKSPPTTHLNYHLPSFLHSHSLTQPKSAVSGKMFLGMMGQNSSVFKSSRWHAVVCWSILWFLFANLRCIHSTDTFLSNDGAILRKSWTAAGYFSNSTGSNVTSGRLALRVHCKGGFTLGPETKETSKIKQSYWAREKIWRSVNVASLSCQTLTVSTHENVTPHVRNRSSTLVWTWIQNYSFPSW